MPIIFGIRRKAYRLATVFAVCRLCGTPAAQGVTRLRTFFTLFFLPVLPLSSKYLTTCTMCGQSARITTEDAEQLVAHAQASAAASPGPPPSYPPPSALETPAPGPGEAGPAQG